VIGFLQLCGLTGDRDPAWRDTGRPDMKTPAGFLRGALRLSPCPS
jgi:hypothetical protein